jgi:hypothetical protein
VLLSVGDEAAAVEQALGGQANAVLRYDSEHDEFRAFTEALHKRRRVAALEDIEGLFFKDDLLVYRERFSGRREAGFGIVMSLSVRASGTNLAPGVPTTQCGGNVLN